MKDVKQLGIWMDNSTATMIELTKDNAITNSVVSGFTHEDRELSLQKGEKLMHNKEQGMQTAYYKKLSDTIRNYDEVILFGPTNAKSELFNLLKPDHLFDNIKIEVRESEKMKESQMQVFVRDYFKK
jgi:hypothetical protein